MPNFPPQPSLGGSVEQGRSGPTGSTRMPDRRRDAPNATTVGKDRSSVRVGSAMPQHQVDRKPLDPDLPHATARRGQQTQLDPSPVLDEPTHQAGASGVDGPPPPQPPVASSEQPSDGEPEKPVVKRIGDVFLVGTNHYAAPVLGEVPQDFGQAIIEPQHLILEGNSGIVHINNYEGLAVRTARFLGKDIHYIGEDLDYDRLHVEAGMSPEVSMFSDAYGFLTLGALRERVHGNEREEAQEIARVEDLLRGVSSTAQTMSDRELHSLVRGWVDNLDTALQTARRDELGVDIGMVGHRIANEYNLQLVDAKHFGPFVAERKNLPGKKTVIVGADHMPNMEKVIRGEQVEVPLPWPDYVAGLPEDHREAVEIFTRLAER